VGTAIEHSQVERQHGQHEKVEENPEEEHRESYDTAVAGRSSLVASR
jgi:hypothetical protein